MWQYIISQCPDTFWGHSIYVSICVMSDVFPFQKSWIKKKERNHFSTRFVSSAHKLFRLCCHLAHDYSRCSAQDNASNVSINQKCLYVGHEAQMTQWWWRGEMSEKALKWSHFPRLPQQSSLQTADSSSLPFLIHLHLQIQSEHILAPSQFSSHLSLPSLTL